MIAATQIKRGMTIKHNGELYRVFSFQHITPGNWRGMVQTKLRSIKSGSIIEHRFRSEDRVEQAYLETHEVEYLYSDGEIGELASRVRQAAEKTGVLFAFFNNHYQGYAPRNTSQLKIALEANE
jgi:hypothetical protein